MRDSQFSETERKRLATAQQLLSVAVDSAATPAERQVAYKRVREELDGLIVVSDEAIVVLEKKVALPLDAAASDARWYDGPLAWFLRRPWVLFLALLVLVAAIFAVLLLIGPPGGRS